MTMRDNLTRALARLAIRAGLNLNWIFDPVHAWRLGQPITLRKLTKEPRK